MLAASALALVGCGGAATDSGGEPEPSDASSAVPYEADMAWIEESIAADLAKQVGVKRQRVEIQCPSSVDWEVGADFRCVVEDTRTGEKVRTTVTMEDDEGFFTWQIDQAAAAPDSATPSESPCLRAEASLQAAGNYSAAGKLTAAQADQMHRAAVILNAAAGDSADPAIAEALTEVADIAGDAQAGRSLYALDAAAAAFGACQME